MNRAVVKVVKVVYKFQKEADRFSHWKGIKR